MMRILIASTALLLSACGETPYSYGQNQRWLVSCDDKVVFDGRAQYVTNPAFQLGDRALYDSAGNQVAYFPQGCLAKVSP